MSNNSSYLFVCGCPRSGTSAITNLLNSHEKIALGMERYKKLLNQDAITQINSRFFEPDKFFNITEKETNLIPKSQSPHLVQHYEHLKNKFEHTNNLIVGDKCPFYFRFYDELNKNFGKAKFIFMIRNIEDVAMSYNVRCNNPEDLWSQDYKMAVRHWNESVVKTFRYMDESNKKIATVFVCEYEKIYSGNYSYFKCLINFLGVDITDDLKRTYELMTANWNERRLKKKKVKDEILNFIHKNANYRFMNKTLDLGA